MALSDEQIDRYSRQILVPEIGGRGQERLLGARVSCLGDSASLATAIDYLSAAGIAVSRDHGDPSSTATTVAAIDAPGLAEVGASRDRPLVVLRDTARAVWYTRRTTSSHCRTCIAQRGDELSESGSPQAVSASDVAGAALALDIIADLLALDPVGGPDLISLTRGGLMRRRIELELSDCSHAVSRADDRSGV